MNVIEDHIGIDSILKSKSVGYALHEAIRDEEGQLVSFTYVDVNDAFSLLVGCPRDTIVGRNAFEIDPNFESEWLRHYGAVLDSQRSDTFLIFSSSVGKWLAVTASCVDAAHFACLYMDVSKVISLREIDESLGEKLESLISGIEAPKALLLERDGSFVYHAINEAYRRVFHVADAAIVGKPIKIAERCGSVGREEYASLYRHVMQDQSSVVHQGQYGRVRLLPYYDGGACVGVIEHYETLKKDYHNDKVLSTAMEEMACSVWLYNILDDVLIVETSTWLDCSQSLSFDVFSERYLHSEDSQMVKERLCGLNCVCSDEQYIEFRGRTPKGAWCWIGAMGKVIARDANEKPSLMTGIFFDITSNRHQFSHVQMMTECDALTGLYNRKKLTSMIKAALSQEHCVTAAGIFLDMDNFKTINDLFGHEVGDELLRAVSKAIVSASPKGSTVARLSGDEFFVFLPNAEDKAIAEALAEKLILTISDTATASMAVHEKARITASAGIVYYPEDVRNAREMLTFADVAMLQAKQNGKNQYRVYHEEYQKRYFKNFQLLQDLRRGIENREFKMYYQPVVRANDMRVLEMEALLRWNHPHYGILTPGEFIHLAEMSGDIIDISHLMLIDIARQVKQWELDDARQGIVVAINVSPIQLGHEGFAESMLKVLSDYEIDPALFCIEITESLALNQTPMTEYNLEKLKRAGCLIALDDFGIAYSTLSKLEDIDFDIIKIDKFFTQSVSESFVSKTVVAMIRNIIEGLGKKCIVEGIETKEQMDIMFEMGFREMQGYYFAKPMEMVM